MPNMSKGRFDSDAAAELGRETFAPLSDAGNRPPNVHYRVPSQEGDLMLAEPPGARIECVTGDGGSSRVTIYDAGTHPAEPTIIADVTVHVPEGATLTEETIAISSALYWSWWRARDMHGEAPR
jgi:hypothetical protein